MFASIFLKIVTLAINASWLILAVIIVRLLIKKAPKWISCLLWGLVALRLICPVSLESTLSLLPSREVIPENIQMAENPQIDSGFRIIDNAVNPVMESTLASEIGNSANPMQVITSVLSVIWIIGFVAMLLYAVVSYILLRKKVSARIAVTDGIYESDEVRSPFILGIIRPMIYVPSGMADDTLELVIAHEKAHLKRYDHLWKPFGFLLLSVYWFNPLCWVAYILLCKDIEAACDEKVIRDKDKDYIAAYSQALLDCSSRRRTIAACPLAFGETGVKERVKGVLNYKKPAFWVIIAAVIACVVVAVCFMTNPKSKTDEESISQSEDIEKYKTDYIGDASKVTQIAMRLPYPGDYAYNHVELQTKDEPYGLTVYLEGTTEFSGNDFKKASDIAFENIGNLEILKFVLLRTGRAITYIDGILDESADDNEISAENKAFLEAWGKMFVERDGDGIIDHTTEDVQKSFGNRELLYGNKGGASFGLSSPWPMWTTYVDEESNTPENGSREPFSIVFQDDYNNGGDILYYAFTSDPHITVWHEHIDFRLDDGKYVVTHEELTYLDNISSWEEYNTAYPIINNTFMDYAKNGLGEALNRNVLLSSSWIYRDLSDPVKAARILLNLSDDEKKVQISVRDNETHPKLCDLQIFFKEDNETCSLTMASPWENGIWIPQDYGSVDTADDLTEPQLLPLETGDTYDETWHTYSITDDNYVSPEDDIIGSKDYLPAETTVIEN